MGGYTVNSYLGGGQTWNALSSPGTAGVEVVNGRPNFKIQIVAPYSGSHSVGVLQTITPLGANALLLKSLSSYLNNFSLPAAQNGMTINEPVLGSSPYGNTNWLPLYTPGDVTFADAPGGF